MVSVGARLGSGSPSVSWCWLGYWVGVLPTLAPAPGLSRSPMEWSSRLVTHLPARTETQVNHKEEPSGCPTPLVSTSHPPKSTQQIFHEHLPRAFSAPHLDCPWLPWTRLWSPLNLTPWEPSPKINPAVLPQLKAHQGCMSPGWPAWPRSPRTRSSLLGFWPAMQAVKEFTTKRRDGCREEVYFCFP